MTDADAPKETTLARGSAIMFFAIVATGGLGVAISIIVARLVGVEDFGIYSIVVGVQSIFTMVAGFGLGAAIGKFVAEYRKRDPAIVARYIKTGLVLGMISSALSLVVYVLLARVIAVDLYSEQAIVSLIPFSALVAVSIAFHALVFGMMQGFQRMTMLAYFQVTVPIVNIAIVVPLVTMFGIQGAFISAFIAQASILLAAMYAFQRKVVPYTNAEVHLWKDEVASKLFNFALPGVMAGLLVVPVFWIGNTELVLTTGFDAMGLMAVALVFYNAFALVPQAVVTPLMPRVSELSVGDLDKVSKTVAMALRYSAILAFPLSFGIALFAEQIVTFLYGSSYSGAFEVMYLLVATGYLTATTTIIGGMIAGLGRMWLSLAINLAWAIAFVVLTFVLVPTEGLMGLGATYAISYGFLLVIGFAASVRLLRHDITSAIPLILGASMLFLLGFLVRELLPDSYLPLIPVLLVGGTLAVLYLGRKDLSSLKGYIRSILPF